MPILVQVKICKPYFHKICNRGSVIIFFFANEQHDEYSGGPFSSGIHGAFLIKLWIIRMRKKLLIFHGVESYEVLLTI